MEKIGEIDLVSNSQKFLIDLSNLKDGLFCSQECFINLSQLQDFYSDISLGMPIMLPLGIESFDYSNVEEIFEVDVREFSQKIFLTDNTNYVGVRQYFKYGNKFCTGAKLKNDHLHKIKTFSSINSALKELNKSMVTKNKKIISFQTRNIPHLGHEKIIEMLLNKYDYVIVNPVIGPKKQGDVRNKILFEVFDYLSKKIYDEKILFYPLCANMFYGGPREAIHHALIRKQSGFKSFVVGRDHAGAENNYDPGKAVEIVNQFKNKIGIEIITHRGSYFDQTEQKIVIKDKTNMNNNLHDISGSEFRDSLKNKEIFNFARKDLQEFLFSLNEDLFY